MKLLNVSHKSINYEFRLLETVNIVEITKAGLFSYLITEHSGRLYCDCPGSVYHHNCWHPSMVKLLKVQETIREPWAEIAEEAGRLQYAK